MIESRSIPAVFPAFDLLSTLSEKRLDVASVWSSSQSIEQSLTRWLDEHLNAAWHDALYTLTELRSRNADDKLEIARRAVVDRWREVLAARAASDWNTFCNGLSQLRKAMSTQGQKTNWNAADLEAAREAMRTLRDHYDAELKPLLGAEASLNFTLDRQLIDALPPLRQLHDRVLQEYQQLKDEQHALDFDDLEGRAADLLAAQPAVRDRWQRDVRAVLVDEFQDTNARQRDIVYALTGFAPDRPERRRVAAKSKDGSQRRQAETQQRCTQSRAMTNQLRIDLATSLVRSSRTRSL